MSLCLMSIQWIQLIGRWIGRTKWKIPLSLVRPCLIPCYPLSLHLSRCRRLSPCLRSSL